MASKRMTIMGTRHVVSAGHYLAAHAGFQILEAGGNAIDAGVAAGIAIDVLQTDKVNFGGVAPQIIYSAKTRKVHCIGRLPDAPPYVAVHQGQPLFVPALAFEPQSVSAERPSAGNRRDLRAGRS